MINKSFLRLWIGTTISSFGSSFTQLVIEIIAVSYLNASPMKMSILVACSTITSIVSSIIISAHSNFFDKKKTLILSDIFRFGILSIFIILMVTDLMSVSKLIFMSIFLVFGDAAFLMAYGPFLTEIVGRARLLNAYSKLTTTGAIVTIAGPSIGGALLAMGSAPTAIAVDAISYLASACLIAGICVPTPSNSFIDKEGPERNPRNTNYSTGFRYIIDNGIIKRLAIRSIILKAMSGAFQAVIFIYYLRYLLLTQFDIGMMSSALGGGLLMGGLIASFVSRLLGAGRVIVFTPVAMALVWIALPMLGSNRAVTMPLLLGSYLSYGACMSIYAVNSTSLRQASTSNDMLVSVEAAMFAITSASSAVGALSMGLLTKVADVRTLLYALVALAVAVAVSGIRSPKLLSIRQIPDGATPA